MSRDILLSLIDADPNQPRDHFDEGALSELIQSMRVTGLISPILLRPSDNGRYIIVHGERRFRAALSLGWSTIPAEIRELDKDEAYIIALVENIQRANLSPIEEAKAYQTLLKQGMTQTELAERLGKSQSAIATKIRLLNLPEGVQKALSSGRLTEGHAKQLLRMDLDTIEGKDVLENVLLQELSVRQTKEMVDFYLLVIVGDKNKRFKDLVTYEREQPEGTRKVQAAYRLGKILKTTQHWWNDLNIPWVVVEVLENFPLTDIYAIVKLDDELKSHGYDIRTGLAMAATPKEMISGWIQEQAKQGELINFSLIYDHSIAYAVKHDELTRSLYV